MQQILEHWLPIANLEDRYQVSDHGKVVSIPRLGTKGKIIAQRLLKSCRSESRWIVTLLTANGRIHPLVSRLVAEAFCVKPAGCNIVNHIDNNPQNNYFKNLEWTTLSGNSQHALKQRRLVIPVMHGELNPCSRYTEDQVLNVITALKRNEPRRLIAARLGVSASLIADIATGRSWKHLYS